MTRSASVNKVARAMRVDCTSTFESWVSKDCKRNPFASELCSDGHLATFRSLNRLPVIPTTSTLTKAIIVPKASQLVAVDPDIRQ